jgi:predicted transcriptional regulator
MVSSSIYIIFNSKETHRITKPILFNKPKKIYYFTAFIKKTGQIDENIKFFDENVAFLEKEMNDLEIIHQEIDYTDYIEVIQELSKIIKEERNHDPTCKIFINIGTGSKITAIASTEASRLWDCNLLYLYSTRYDPFDTGATHKGELLFKTPQVFPIQKPDEVLIKVLKIIQKALMKKYNGKQTESSQHFVYKKKLLEILEEEGFLKLKKQHKNPRFTQSSYYMKLNHRYLKPLASELNYIEISKDKRNKKIFITDKGKIILSIFRYLI